MGKRKVPLTSVDENQAEFAKLSAFGLKAGRINSETRNVDKSADSDVVVPTVTQCKTTDSDVPTVRPTQCNTPSKSARKFVQSWMYDRPWLRYDSKEKLMFCDVCIQAFVKNTFTSGCGSMKKECITKHKKGTGDNSHAAALALQKQTTDMQISCSKAISKNKTAVLAAFRNVQFAAENNLANAMVPKLNDLCINQGASHLLDLCVDNHTTYEHHSSICEFQECMASVIEDNLVDRVNKSGVFSVMLDESTDVSVHQNMVVYVRFLDTIMGRTEPVTRFLGIRQLSTATADSITTELLDLLKEKRIDVANLVGVATDGASVMVGCRKGVVTRLKEICPGLIGTHCIAHRLALASGSAADSVRYLVKFQEILNSLFKYFDNSPKNMARLEGIQSILDDAKGSRLKQIFHTRWLSFSGSVQSIVDNYANVVSVLLEDKSAKALAMHKPMTCYKFLYTVHFLADALRHLSVLCKAYQRSNILFTDVSPLLQSTVSVLCDLRDQIENSGPNLKKYLEQVPNEPGMDNSGLTTFLFNGHTVRDGASQRQEAISACDTFITNVEGQLRDRFTETGDASIMSAITRLFDPAICSDGSDEDDVDTTVEYLVSCQLGDDVDCRQEIVAFCAFAKAKVSSRPKSFNKSTDLAQLATEIRFR